MNYAIAETTVTSDEADRLRALYEYSVLDSAPEQIFDDITLMAAEVCGVPISLVSLVDSDRQWFKSRYGLDATETPRQVSFCSVAIQRPDQVLEVQDTHDDEHFSLNPLVTGPPFIRFYAGVPLISGSGYALGTLCVIDREPKCLTSHQLDTLRRLSRLVVAQLEARKNFHRLQVATEELLQSEQRLKLAAEGSTDGLWDWQLDGDQVWYSPRFIELLDYDGPHEFPGELETFSAHLHPEDEAHTWEAVRAHLEDGEPYDVEYRLRTKLGNYRWFRARGASVRDNDGTAIRMAGSIQDITRMRNAAVALREANLELENRVTARTAELAESRARYQSLYDDAPDMLVSVAANSGKIVDCNQTLIEALGYERAELIGLEVVNLFVGEDQSLVRDVFGRLAKSDEVRDLEVTFATAVGESLEVSLHISPVSDDSAGVVHTVCRDITERRRLESEAQSRREELDRALRLATLGEMATTLAHELNQPLYAISNFARGAVLRLESGCVDGEMLTQVLNDIADESTRAGEVIRGVRRCIGSGEQKRDFVAPSELLASALKVTQFELRQRETVFELDLQDSLPHVCCDSVLIEQVVVNLILNALDAMVQVPKPQRSICLSVCSNPNSVEFAVRDFGCGIADDIADRVFEPFFTTKGSGVGMGLAICKTIIEHHRGSIFAQNEDRGATVGFSLPIEERKES